MMSIISQSDTVVLLSFTASGVDKTQSFELHKKK